MELGGGCVEKIPLTVCSSLPVPIPFINCEVGWLYPSGTWDSALGKGASSLPSSKGFLVISDIAMM